ncbi:JAB domain-containing protein [Levilactobacillus yonginensis]|uniref:JAB domain-containing protein n=1 Tax=Levilactobacillus yonginensis TaxID=1054041 RepID=UPI00345DA658
MQRCQVTVKNERQLVSRVLATLGLADVQECDRFFHYFQTVARLRYASQRQCRAYVAGQPRRQAFLQALALGRWSQRAPREILGVVQASSQIGQALMDDLRFLPQEQLEVLALDAKHQIIDRQTVFRGTLDSCPVHPREIFRVALVTGAAAVVVAHNHPSGDTTPSRNDLLFMNRLAKCGQLMGVPLLDGFVVGLSSYFSLRENGQLPIEMDQSISEPLKTD